MKDDYEDIDQNNEDQMDWNQIEAQYEEVDSSEEEEEMKRPNSTVNLNI